MGQRLGDFADAGGALPNRADFERVFEIGGAGPQFGFVEQPGRARELVEVAAQLLDLLVVEAGVGGDAFGEREQLGLARVVARAQLGRDDEFGRGLGGGDRRRGGRGLLGIVGVGRDQ